MKSTTQTIVARLPSLDAHKTATQLLHAHVGAPAFDGCVDDAIDHCYVCAGTSLRSMPIAKWMGDNFTGQAQCRAPMSDRICEACAWAMAGRPPDTLRMYSHLFDGREYLRLNKGDKPAMRAFLRRHHDTEWFAAIADSGKKHVIPWAPVNQPGRKGRVRFEDGDVTLPRSEDGWAMVDEIAALATAGAPKSEIESGDYSPRSWTLCRAAIESFERRWKSERHGAWFRLAVWLAQRDEVEAQARMDQEKADKAEKKGAKRGNKTDGRGARATADANGGGLARGAEALPHGVRVDGVDEALGPPVERDADRDKNDVEPRGVGVDDGAQASSAGPAQLGLPGFA